MPSSFQVFDLSAEISKLAVMLIDLAVLEACNPVALGVQKR